MNFERTVTNKGKECLIYKNSRFRKATKYVTNQIKWRCSIKTCSASIVTDPDVSSIIAEAKQHNHDSYCEKDIRMYKVRAACKTKAKQDMNKRPFDIFTNITSAVDHEVERSYLPHVRQAIYRQRKKLLKPAVSKLKRPLGRPRRGWEDIIRMDLKEIGINARNWVDSTQESPCECCIEPPGSISNGVSFY